MFLARRFTHETAIHRAGPVPMQPQAQLCQELAAVIGVPPLVGQDARQGHRVARTTVTVPSIPHDMTTRFSAIEDYASRS